MNGIYEAATVEPMVEDKAGKERIVEFKKVSKKFGSNQANDEVSFEIYKNEVHAILGENGAGKSTIMSILFGLYSRDDGDVIVKGNLVNYRSAKDANADGIAMLPQHFKLIDNMTVLENIILGKEEHKAFLLDMKAARNRLLSIMQEYNLKLEPDAMVDSLSVSEKQRVELLKILWTNAEIMILDEPTSILTPNEIENFLELVIGFKNLGKTVVIITHKLDEVKKVADRCTVMRKGAVVASHYVAGLSETEMAHMMVGRAVDLRLSSLPRARTTTDRAGLSVENLFLKQRISQKALNGVSFEVRAGEILGIAAVEGNGQSELFKIVGGMLAPDAGEVFMNGEQVTDWSIKRRYSSQRLPKDEIISLKAQIGELRSTLKYVEKEEAESGEIYTKAGGSRSSAIRRQIKHFRLLAKRKRAYLAHVPEDRQEHGLILDFACADNAVLQDINNYGRFGFYIRSDAVAKLDFLIRNYDIRGVETPNLPARALSGGNQQKLILGREIERQAAVLLAYNPTRGLDVGSIRRVYEQLIRQRDNGAAVLLYSGELEEVLEISDRVAIMHNGVFVGVYQARDISRDEAGLAMFTGTPPAMTTRREGFLYIDEVSINAQTEMVSAPSYYLPHEPMVFVNPVPSFYPLLPEYASGPFVIDRDRIETLIVHKAEAAKSSSTTGFVVLRPQSYIAKKRKRKTATKLIKPVAVDGRVAVRKKSTIPASIRPRNVVKRPRSDVHKTVVTRTVRTTVVRTVSRQKGVTTSPNYRFAANKKTLGAKKNLPNPIKVGKKRRAIKSGAQRTKQKARGR